MILMLFVLTNNKSIAQCTITSNDGDYSSGYIYSGGTYDNYVGEGGIIACSSGKLTTIKVLCAESLTGLQLRVNSANGPIATISNVSIHAATSAYDYSEVDLSAYNLSVTNGEKYAFVLIGSSMPKVYCKDFGSNASSMYPNGYRISGGNSGGGANYTIDLYFEMEIESSSYSIPTSANFTPSDGPYYNTNYTFNSSDFSYSDNNTTVLDHIKITRLPYYGTLYFDANGNKTLDSGEEIAIEDEISYIDLNNGRLNYIYDGQNSSYMSFVVSNDNLYSLAYSIELKILYDLKVSLITSPAAANGTYEMGEQVNYMNSWEHTSGNYVIYGEEDMMMMDTYYYIDTDTDPDNGYLFSKRASSYPYSPVGQDYSSSGGTGDPLVEMFVPAPAADPVLNTNAGLTLNEGASSGITSSLLDVSDEDTDDADLIFTVTTAPTKGQLENSDNAGTAASSFTMQDIIDGKISYTHDDSETTNDEFIVSVSDGTSSIDDINFAISINPIDDETPTVDVNTGLTLDEGASEDITSSILSASDEDSDDATLTFTVTTAPANGQIENSDNAGTAASSFTMQNISDGKIAYTHNDSETDEDSFIVSVSDGTNTLNDVSVSITVTPVDDETPTVDVNTGLTLDEGTSEDITSSILLASDEDSDDATLTFTVTTSPANGQIENSDNAGTAASSFTMQDITNGKISYVHSNNETNSDSFVFSVSDGTNSLNDVTFNITINNLSGLQSSDHQRFDAFLYPYISDGLLTVSVENGEEYGLIVYNISGRIVKEMYSLTNEQNLDICNEPAGMYLIKIVQKNSDIRILKTIKQ